MKTKTMETIKKNYVNEEVPTNLSWSNVKDCTVRKGAYFACYFDNCQFEEGSDFSGCKFSGENRNNYISGYAALYGD